MQTQNKDKKGTKKEKKRTNKEKSSCMEWNILKNKENQILWGTRGHKVVHFDLHFDNVLLLKATLLSRFTRPFRTGQNGFFFILSVSRRLFCILFAKSGCLLPLRWLLIFQTSSFSTFNHSYTSKVKEKFLAQVCKALTNKNIQVPSTSKFVTMATSKEANLLRLMLRRKM